MKNDIKFLIFNEQIQGKDVEVRIQDETIWLSQKSMSLLFETSTDNIGLHLKNVYADGELFEDSTAEDFSVVQIEGSREITRTVKHYNLDAIISVGYRVNSAKATQFRIWATKDFYAMVQNKFHFAITGNTAAEIIYAKAEAEQKATEEYNEFNKTQKIISDFDKYVSGLKVGSSKDKKKLKR